MRCKVDPYGTGSVHALHYSQVTVSATRDRRWGKQRPLEHLAILRPLETSDTEVHHNVPPRLRNFRSISLIIVSQSRAEEYASLTILQLFSSKNQTLLIGRNTLSILDHALQMID